ncbi:MAG: hypothetical protein K2O14_00190 [Oscillospiraceae bacterium]|nr:hypothetical protein [Oscillospiraceae bacterium]
MCRVATGEQLNRWCDVQNLITGSIFRSTLPFNAISLADDILSASRGSQLKIKNIDIKNMVNDTILSFLRAGLLSVSMDNYSLVLPTEMSQVIKKH